MIEVADIYIAVPSDWLAGFLKGRGLTMEKFKASVKKAVAKKLEGTRVSVRTKACAFRAGGLDNAKIDIYGDLDQKAVTKVRAALKDVTAKPKKEGR